MKKGLTVFALAAGLNSFSLPAFTGQEEATKTRQPVKMTEQQLDHRFNKRSYRTSKPTGATNAEIDRYVAELWRRSRSLEGRDEHADSIVALIRKLMIQAARLELIESGVIPTQTPIDLDNYQTPPKDPCDWSWYIVDQDVNRLGGFTVARDNEHNAVQLMNLMEEGVEAAQAASKVLRFRMHDRYQIQPVLSLRHEFGRS